MMSTVLPTPAPPKRPGLAPLHVGLEQVDDLDSGLEHLDLRGLILEARSLAVDRPTFLHLDVAQLVHGLADDVDDAPRESLRRRAR
jgi:hypothetical protein